MDASQSHSRLLRLLWFDCSAGFFVGLLQLVTGPWLSTWLGLPLGLLRFTALANVGYAAFSFSLARQASASLSAVRLLVFANFAWAVASAGFAFWFASAESALGVAYLCGEGLFVALLAGVELRALRAALTHSKTRSASEICAR
jgi:hypothetical protein